MGVQNLINEGVLKLFNGGVIDNTTDCSLPLVALNSSLLDVTVTKSEKVQLIIAATTTVQSRVNIELAANANLELVVWLAADSFLNLAVKQAEGAQCKSFVSVASSSDATFTFDLDGHNGSNIFDAVFVATHSDHAKISLTTRHNVSDCTSKSLVKGVSADRATGEFRGLVYVAPDAQRTDAQQQNRNIELDDSHIVALPQLEIYADDVRCSHGSTVGYADTEALFYMRQRGLDLQTARRMQIVGFIEDVVSRCSIEPICCLIGENINEKLSNI